MGNQAGEEQAVRGRDLVLIPGGGSGSLTRAAGFTAGKIGCSYEPWSPIAADGAFPGGREPMSPSLGKTPAPAFLLLCLQRVGCSGLGC